MKLKVYGGCLDGLHRQIVAAKSFAEACRLWRTTYAQARPYACETFNEFEIALAMSKPGIMFRRTSNGRWTKVKR